MKQEKAGVTNRIFDSLIKDLIINLPKGRSYERDKPGQIRSLFKLLFLALSQVALHSNFTRIFRATRDFLRLCT